MTTSRIAILSIVLVVSQFLHAQLSIPLISERVPCNCAEKLKVDNERISELKEQPLKNSFHYEEMIESLKELLEQDSLTPADKVYCNLKLVEIYSYYLFEDNDFVYNVNQAEQYWNDYDEVTYETIDTSYLKNTLNRALKGSLIINSHYEEALKNADEKSKECILKSRLNYFVNSGILDQLYEIGISTKESDQLYLNLDELGDIIRKGNAAGADVTPFSIVNTDYQLTGFNPDPSYLGLGTGITSAYGKDMWIGGELSIDYAESPNPFLISDRLSGTLNTRYSIYGIGYMNNLNTGGHDFSFFFSRITNLLFMNLTLANFGFRWGGNLPTSKAYWFYRPEIGFTYGVFTLSYGYNLMFNKPVRSLTDRHMLTFKISYPLVKLGK